MNFTTTPEERALRSRRLTEALLRRLAACGVATNIAWEGDANEIYAQGSYGLRTTIREDQP